MTGFDARELSAFAVDVGRVSQITGPAVRQALRDSAIAIQDTMRRDLRGSAHFKRVADDVTTTFTESDDLLTAEIGPEIGRGRGHAGSLAHIAYFGTSTTPGGASVDDPQHALDEEAPRFERAVEDIIDSVVMEGLQ